MTLQAGFLGSTQSDAVRHSTQLRVRAEQTGFFSSEQSSSSRQPTQRETSVSQMGLPFLQSESAVQASFGSGGGGDAPS